MRTEYSSRHLQQVKVLGEGSYGVVYSGFSKSTGAKFAIKSVRLDVEDEDGIPSTTLREICLLKQLKEHENIINLSQVITTRSKVLLVFELMESDLHDHIKQRFAAPSDGVVVAAAGGGGGGGFQPHEVQSIMKQLVRGMAFCHAQRVIHRDLKPANVLVKQNSDGQLTVKIADFGLARTCGVKVDEFSECVVTLWYRSPDVLCGNTFYSNDIDVWSLGCIFAELGVGVPLLRGKSTASQAEKMFAILGHPCQRNYPEIEQLPGYPEIAKKVTVPLTHKGFPFERLVPSFANIPGALDLLRAMLEYHPQRRISCAEALQHPFFQ